ncbi:MAG: glycosyltransferase 87 family protein [Chloroflexota bacterium]|nr:glycosyltransferase 87 family protein [Chloroflexota bacterium]
MSTLNYEVDGKKREPADVAKEFLTARGLLKKQTRDGPRANIRTRVVMRSGKSEATTIFRMLRRFTRMTNRRAESTGEPGVACPPRWIARSCRAWGTKRPLNDLALLVLIGSALVAGSWQIARWSFVPHHSAAFGAIFVAELALYAAASAWVIRRCPPVRPTIVVIFVIAAAVRLLLVPAAPTVSDDIYRYVWDGRIQSAGINPYAYPPDAPELARFRDDAIYPGINRKPVRTIYPPVAEVFFRAVSIVFPNSVRGMKLTLTICDLLTCAVLAMLLRVVGARPERVILYAWHPLLALEVAHSGHLDALAVLLVALALWARLSGRFGRAGALLAGAALVKFYALVALPALLVRARRPLATLLGTLCGAIALAYLPFLAVGSHVLGYLGGYVAEEGIASGTRYYLLKQFFWAVRHLTNNTNGDIPAAATNAYQVGIVGVMAAIALWCVAVPPRSAQEIADRIALLFVVLLALASPVQPWYMLLLLGTLPLVGRRILLPASLVVGSAGLVYLTWWLPGSPAWPIATNYDLRAVAVAILLVGAVRRWLIGRQGAKEPAIHTTADRSSAVPLPHTRHAASGSDADSSRAQRAPSATET